MGSRNLGLGCICKLESRLSVEFQRFFEGLGLEGALSFASSTVRYAFEAAGRE